MFNELYSIFLSVSKAHTNHFVNMDNKSNCREMIFPINIAFQLDYIYFPLSASISGMLGLQALCLKATRLLPAVGIHHLPDMDRSPYPAELYLWHLFVCWNCVVIPSDPDQDKQLEVSRYRCGLGAVKVQGLAFIFIRATGRKGKIKHTFMNRFARLIQEVTPWSFLSCLYTTFL